MKKNYELTLTRILVLEVENSLKGLPTPLLSSGNKF
jgi:hypothetical protein